MVNILKFIKISIPILQIGLSILCFFILKNIIKEFNFKKVKKNFYATFEEKLDEVKEGYFSKERIEKFIKKKGNPFKLKSAEQFLLVKIFFGIMFMLIFTKEFGLLIGMIGCILGFFLTDLMYIAINKSQEKDQVIDLAEICDSLRIQLKGGTHITNALSECYLIAKDKRLKEAFLTLQSELFLTNDVERALINFNECFDNRYIKTFVAAIHQGQKSGKTNQTIEDLTGALKDVSKVLDNKKERAIDNKMSTLTILIFIWIFTVAGYALGLYLMANMKGMWN